jgi:iron-sulfur cluster repair protein YtfE (RIC family)
MEALLKLEKARAELNLGYQKTLTEKREEIERIIAPIDRGLRKHYSFEEEVLPPMLGRVLTEALISEHKHLLFQMEQMISLLTEINAEGLTPAQALGKESLIYERLDNLRRDKLDHLNREEAVLLTLQNVIELKTKYP